MTDLASFGFGIDSSQAAAAADNLDRMAGATDRASASSQGLVTASARLTAEIAATAAAVVAAEAAHRRLIDASDGYARAVATVTSATSAFGRAIADVVAETGRAIAQFEMAGRAVDALGAAFRGAGGMITDASRALAGFGSAMADHLQRTFPAMTDAVVRLAGTVRGFATDLAGSVSDGFAAMYRASGPALEALGTRAGAIFSAIAASAASAQAVAASAVETIVKRIGELTSGLSLGGAGGSEGVFGRLGVSGEAFASLLERMRETLGKLGGDIAAAFEPIGARAKAAFEAMSMAVADVEIRASLAFAMISKRAGESFAGIQAAAGPAFAAVRDFAVASLDGVSAALSPIRDRISSMFSATDIRAAATDAGRAIADGAGSFASQAGRVFEGLADTIGRVVAALKNAALLAADVAGPVVRAGAGLAADIGVPVAGSVLKGAGSVLKGGLRLAGPVGDAMLAHDIYQFIQDQIASINNQATESQVREAFEQAKSAPAQAAYRTAAATAGITGMGVAQQYDATSAAGQLGIDPAASVQAFARLGSALKDAGENGVQLRAMLRDIGVDANAFSPEQSYGLLETILHRLGGLAEGDKASFIARFFGQNAVGFVQGLTENTDRLSAATDRLNKTLAERDEKIRQATEAQKVADQQSAVVPLVSGTWSDAFHFAAQGDLVTTKKELDDYNRKAKETFDQDLADKQLIMAEYDRRLAELNRRTAQSGAGFFGRIIGGISNWMQADAERDANAATVAAGGALPVAPLAAPKPLDQSLIDQVNAATGGSPLSAGVSADRIRSTVQSLLPLLRNGQISIDQARQFLTQGSAAYGGSGFVQQAWDALATTSSPEQMKLQGQADATYDRILKGQAPMAGQRTALEQSEEGRRFLATLDSGAQDQAGLQTMAGTLSSQELRDNASGLADATLAIKSLTDNLGTLNDQVRTLGATVEQGAAKLESLRDVADKQAIDSATGNPLGTLDTVSGLRTPWAARTRRYDVMIGQQRRLAGSTAPGVAGEAGANVDYLGTPEGIQDVLGGRNPIGMLQERIDEAEKVRERMENAARAGNKGDAEALAQQEQIINRMNYQLRSLQDPIGRMAENLYLQAQTLDTEGFARRRQGALRSATLRARSSGQIGENEDLSGEDQAAVVGGYGAIDAATINQIGRQMTRSASQTADLATATTAGSAAVRDMTEAWKIQLEVAKTDEQFRPLITKLIQDQTEAELALARAKGDSAARQETADQELLAAAWTKGAAAAHEAQLAIEGVRRARAEGYDRGDEASAAGQRRIAGQIVAADAAKTQAQFGQMGDAQRKEVEVQRLNYDLLGSSNTERAKAVEMARVAVDLQEKHADLTAEGTRRYIEQAGEIARVKEVINENTALAQNMAQTIGSSLDKAFSDPALKARDVFKALGADMQHIFFHEAVTKPIQTFITGSIGKLLNPDITQDPGAVPVAGKDPGTVDRLAGMMRGQIALTDQNAIPVRITNAGFKELGLPEAPTVDKGAAGGADYGDTVRQSRASGIPAEQWTSRVSARELDAYIEKIAQEQGVDPDLIRRVVSHESGWNPNARGSSGEIGYMQLMPETAKSLGVNPYDWKQNISGGVTYLRQALADNEGDTDLALTQYNRGAGGLSEVVRKFGEDVDAWPEKYRRYFESVDQADEAVRGFTSSLKDASVAVGTTGQGAAAPIVINRADGSSEVLGGPIPSPRVKPAGLGETQDLGGSGAAVSVSGLTGGVTGGVRSIVGGDYLGGATQLFGTAQHASGAGLFGNAFSGWSDSINRWGQAHLGTGMGLKAGSMVRPGAFASDAAAAEAGYQPVFTNDTLSGYTPTDAASGASLAGMGGSAVGGAMAGFSTGYAIGGMVGTKTGSRGAGIGVGALSGAASGALMGMSAGPYGAAIGAAVGAIAGAIGGGVGTSKPSNFGIGGSVDLSTGAVDGWSDKPSDQTRGWQQQFVTGVNQLRDAITRSGAGTLSGAIGFDIGSRDKNSVTVAGVKTTVEPGDVTGMLNAVAKALPTLIQGASKEVSAALTKNAGDDFNTLIPKLTFAASLKTAIEDLNKAADKLTQQGQIAAQARKGIDDSTTSLLQFLGAIGAIYGSGGDSRFTQYGFDPNTRLPSATRSQIPITSLAGFAAGTSGAAPGWAWVGEQGRELVHFQGGETVLPHAESLRRAGSFPGYEEGTGTGSSSSIGSSVSNALGSIGSAISSAVSAVGSFARSVGQSLGVTDSSGNTTAAGGFVTAGGSLGWAGYGIARAMGWATGATGQGSGMDNNARQGNSGVSANTLSNSLTGGGLSITLTDAQVAGLTDRQKAIIGAYAQYGNPGPNATTNQVGYANQVTNEYNHLLSELQGATGAQQDAAQAAQNAAQAQEDAAAEIRRQALAAAQGYARSTLASTTTALSAAIDPTKAMDSFARMTVQINATFDALVDQFKALGLSADEVKDSFKQVAQTSLTTTTRGLAAEFDPSLALSNAQQMAVKFGQALKAQNDLYAHLGLDAGLVNTQFTGVARTALNASTTALSAQADPTRAVTPAVQMAVSLADQYQAAKTMFQALGADTSQVNAAYAGVARTSLGASTTALSAQVDPTRAITPELQMANTIADQYRAARMMYQSVGADTSQVNAAYAGVARTSLGASTRTLEQGLDPRRAATDGEQQAARIVQTFDGLTATFKALGMSTTEVEAKLREVKAVMADTFNTQTANQVRAIQQPFLETLRQIDEEQVKAKRNAIASGGNMVEVEKLYAEKRRVAFEQTFQSLIDWVKNQAIGAQSPGGPESKMTTAQAEYERLLKLVQAGDTSKIGQLQSAASAYLQTARDYYASSPAYGTIYNRVTGQVQSIADANNPNQTATSSSTTQQQAVSTSHQNQQTTQQAQQQAAAVAQQQAEARAAQQAAAAQAQRNQAAAAQQAQRNQEIVRAQAQYDQAVAGLARNDSERSRMISSNAPSNDIEYMNQQHDAWARSVAQWKAYLVQIRGYVEGGWVANGAWNKDSVTASLAGGEFVMPAEKAARFAPQLEAMRAGASNDNGALVAELRGLRQDVQALTRVSAASGQISGEGLAALGERLSGIERQTRLQNLAA